MSISIYISPIAESSDLIILLLQQEFGLNPTLATQLAQDIDPHFKNLKDSIYLLAETSYVDKVYRDSYYNYYSSKLNQNKRDCLRISIFDGEINSRMFEDTSMVDSLKNKYCGFLVIRPTIPYIIGRSIISPKALKDNSFISCLTKVHATANCIKLQIEGFPHSSQDTETISCAETTIWAIMEYFSSKYQEYKPVLPSKIIATLSKMTNQRQVPSKGLTIQQISYALKEFGFGTRIYSKAEYNEDFEKLLSYYVESGIPLILGIDNYPTGVIGHAIVCIGHEVVMSGHIDALKPTTFTEVSLQREALNRRITVYDWADTSKKFIFIDDNCPIYQKAYLDSPTAHYPTPDWHSCEVKHFITPLYPKIYLEAYEARNFIYSLLLIGPAPIHDNSEMLIRLFLTSSRSFKNELSLNSSFIDIGLKKIILESPMPKFIWVAELSSKDLIKGKLANGLVILDATEPNITQLNPLIIGAYNDMVIKFEESSRRLEKNVLPLHPFSIYNNNLKPS
jgi:hypothetical protein